MKKRQTQKKKIQAHALPRRLENELAVVQSQSEVLVTTVKHFANLGDIIAVLPAIKKYYEVTKRKVVLAQQVNQLAAYYPGAVHPTVNEDGQNVCVNDAMYDMIKPLVESQEYIHKMERYEGQHVDLDFDVIRGDRTFVNMPNGMIQAWIMYAFPDLACDLTQPWVTLPEVKDHPILKQVKGKIILNFTERYRNTVIDYFFMKKYAPDLIFAGTDREHWLFCNKWQLSIPRLEVKDFLEYAYAIKGARFLFGNQSLGWNLSEALKTPRVLEMCRYAPNCHPFVGVDSYGFFHQVGAEYYWRKLYNDTMNK
jgi:hypothetical protein